MPKRYFRSKGTSTTLRHQLAGLVLAAVLPVWLVSGLLVFHGYSVKREQMQYSMQESARALAMIVDRELFGVQAALVALATSPSFARSDMAAVHDQVADLLRSYPGADLIVADASGQQLVNSARPFGTPLPKRNNPETVRRIFADGQPIVSDLFFGALSKRPLISIDVPVRVRGEVAYDLAMTFPAERLAKILSQQRLPAQWYSVILDSKSLVVARSGDSGRLVGKPANPVHARLSHLREGSAEYTNIEGKKSLIAFSRSGASNLNLVVGVPKDTVMAQIYQWTGWALAASALISLFGLQLSLGYARRISRALHGLVAPAQAIGRGEQVAPFEDHGVEEVAAVGSALMQASDLLQQRAADLHRSLASLEREMAERQVSQESLRLLVDGARDYSIVMLSAEGLVTSWNEGAKRLTGWEAAELLGRPAALFYPEAAVAAGRPQANLGTAAVEGRCSEEGERLRKDGSSFLADVIITAIRDDQGRLRGFSKVTRDITERKEAEARLQATLVELERSNRELEQFAYVASHDLQEPLRMVGSYTQLLAQRYQGRLDEKAEKFIEYAVDGAQRMQQLINDLLAYSRVSSRGSDLVPIEAQGALDDALRNLAGALAEPGARVLAGELPTVPADAAQLRQLFQNLISNALKFRGEQAPEVRVTASDLGDQWCFSVADNGIGLDRQYADKVFIIFQRLHGRQEYPGTGIGLAICKRIVERHGGRIWFDSTPGAGSTFHFTLPKHKDTP